MSVGACIALSTQIHTVNISFWNSKMFKQWMGRFILKLWWVDLLMQNEEFAWISLTSPIDLLASKAVFPKESFLVLSFIIQTKYLTKY